MNTYWSYLLACVATVLCASLIDLFIEFVRARAVADGELRDGHAIPGLHWLGASIGAFVPLAIAFLVLCPGRLDWFIGVALLAGAVGAVVDLPFSAVRNWRAGRSPEWAVGELLALGGVAVLLGAASCVAFLICLLRNPASWGAPA